MKIGSGLLAAALLLLSVLAAVAQVPASPTSLTAAGGTTSIVLNWQHNLSNVQGFKVERKVGAGGTWALYVTLVGNFLGYTDTGVSAGNTYYYRVYAYNAAGPSQFYSNEASASLQSVPASPTSLTASGGTSSIALSWQDNANNEQGFRIERKIGAGGSWGLYATVGANVTAYTDTGVVAGNTYYYRVYAYNAAGSSQFYSNEASATPQSVPAAPTTLTASGGTSSIGLSWSHNLSNVQGFKVERKVGAGGTWALYVTLVGNFLGYTDTGVSAGNTYYYRVYAYNAAGNSPYSSEASAALQGAPASPTSLTASGGTSSIGLSWSHNLNNVQGFKVERKVGAGGTWALYVTLTGNFLGYTDTGVSAGNTYYYRVYAYNAAGNSPLSNEASTTLQTPTYTITTTASPPAGGTAGGGGDFTSGQTATVTATANNGYGFVNWTEGGNQASTSASYPFTVTANRSLIANFGRTATVVGTDGLGLRLRSNANLSSTVLAVIPDGSIVIALGNTQSADGYVWWQVRYLAQDGWAASDFLALTSTGTPPTPPSVATLLQQFQANGTTSISGGGTANASSVVLAARTSGTSGQQMKIQFEVRPAGGSFLSPTHESAFVPGGTEARITASGLANQGYDWRARVLDANGQASSWTQFSASSPDFVVSTPALPSALFSWSPTQPFVNNTVQFTASAAGTAGLTFAWNFGDGGTATGPTPNHAFAQAGQRTVTLTVTDSQSRQATRAETLTVASSQLPDAINLLAQRTANLYDTMLAEAQQCANAADYFQQGVDSAQSRIAISAAFDAISLGIDTATFKGWLESSIGEEILGQTVLDLERTATERVITKKANQSHSGIFMPNIQTFISQRKAEIEQLRQQAIAASGSLSPSQAEQLARNLQARSAGNIALANNYSSKALLPTTFADLKAYDENSWTFLVGEKLFGASVGLGMILTGGAAHGTLAVMLSVSGTTALGTLDKLNILSGQSMDAQMLGLSVNVLGQSTFTAREMADNAKRGMQAVIGAQVPVTPAGQLSVEHVAQGALDQFGFSPRWFTTTAYADVTIHNTGTVQAQYRLEAAYPKSFTTTQLLPFRTYGIGERSYDINVLSVANWIQVNAGAQATIRLYYKTADGGQIPRGLISYTLTAKTADGHYLQDVETGHFGTTYLDENGQVVDPSQLPSGLLLADTPLRSALLQYGTSKVCNLSIYVDNPVESPLLVNLQQPIPVGTSVIEAAGGTANNNQMSWEFNLQPGEARVLQVTMNLPSLPGNPPLPDTAVAAYDTVNASWLQFSATPSLLQITNLPPSQVQALGFSGGAFGVALHTFIPGAYRVEATKNFSTWETVASSTNAQGILNFQDPAAQTNSLRFYRGIKIH